MEEKTVSLSLETIIRECSKRKDQQRDHFMYFSLENRENIHEIFKYKKFNEDFTSQLDCFNTGEYTVGTIRPSYDEFLNKLMMILNVRKTPSTKDDDQLTKKLLERLEVLKSIKTESDLQREFPFLYKDLIDGRRYYDSLQKLRKQEGYSKDQYASGEHYYYGCALKKSLQNFIETQAVMYERYILKRKELQAIQSKKSYNKYLKDNFDLDKLYLYVVHEYLRVCESTTDRTIIKKYIALIDKYLSSDRNFGVQITTDENIKVDIENIKKRLENIKRVVADNSSMVDWVIIPEGRVYDRVKKEDGEPKTTIFNQEELEALRKAGERKSVFYESTSYEAKAIGLRRYKGYVAYIYKNGEVLIDKEFNDNAPFSMKDNAIYRMKVVDFEALSKLDKQKLMRHPKVGRIYHTPTWEKRTKLIIEREATPQEEQETDALIKRLKKVPSRN